MSGQIDEAEAARIAKALTKAQREWLLRQQPTTDPVKVAPCAEWWDCPPLYVAIDGSDYWLAGQSMKSPEGAAEFTEGETHLYPLGLAVRKQLEAANAG